MIDYLADLVQQALTPMQGRNLAREYLILCSNYNIMISLLCYQANCMLSYNVHIQRVVTYDLLWYLSDSTWPGPNLILLNNALTQTNWLSGEVTESNWRGLILERLQRLDWNNIVTDVSPFIEPGFDPSLLTLANLERVLRG